MDPTAHMRAHALIEARRYEDAIRALKDALANDPRDARALYLIGHCQLAMDHPEEAERCAKAALGIDGSRSEFHVLLAHAVLNLGRPGAAMAHTRDALSIDPDDTEAHFIRSAALFTEGRRKEALTPLNRVLELEPDHERALALKARVLSAGAYHQRAGETLASALRIDPNNSHTLAVKAWSDYVHQRSGDHAGAFRKVLAMEPFNKLARRGLVLSTSIFSKRLAAREQRAEEGPIGDDEQGWASVTIFCSVLVAIVGLGASGGGVEFIGLGGMFYSVTIAFFMETWPCLLLLPSLLMRRTRELLPPQEALHTLVADLWVMSGAAWCAIAPAVRGVHSIWGISALFIGASMLHFRFTRRGSRAQLIRWAYLGGIIALVVATMALPRGVAVWTSIGLFFGSVLWFRFHGHMEKR